MTTRQQAAWRFGTAWVGLCLILAAHVTDEALTGFLEVYNPTARAIRARFPFLPLPTFTFRVWLALLILAVSVLLALSFFAYRGARAIVLVSYPFGIIMLANGLLHLTSSIYFRRLMPGVWSSPLLLAGSVYLLYAARELRGSGSSVTQGGTPERRARGT